MKSRGKLRRLMLDRKSLLIILLAIALSILVLAPPVFHDEPIRIEDKCGKFINLMSHTIEDEKTCRSRCRPQCGSIGKSFGKIRFAQNANECNTCECFCR